MSQYDYTVLAKVLGELVGDVGFSEVIESNSNGPQPDYPFWTYTVISPYLPITTDVVGGEVFECVISLTVHDISGLAVLNHAMKLNKCLRLTETKYYLQNKNVVLVSLSNVNKRDNLISIEYERTAGFDIRLRIKDDYVGDIPQIENIEV